MWWWKKSRPAPVSAETIRNKYSTFRRLLALNSECLELMAGLQEDLLYVPPRANIAGPRAAAIFEHAEGAAAALEKLSGHAYPALFSAVSEQRHEVEVYLAAATELATPRFSVWLYQVCADAAPEVGGKAAALGEIKNRLRLSVPDGFVITTEAYRRFCGIPLWTAIRDASRAANLNDLHGLQAISAKLTAMVMACPVPRAIEVAITERAPALRSGDLGLAVRSSGLVEGGERTFAGQFVSLINVAREQLVDAYKTVVASRFSERALSYRLSTGFTEVESPMAVLFLPVLHARASGIIYTRDPRDPRSDSLWITATRGLGLDIASGRMPADLFVLSRRHGHPLLESKAAQKSEEILPEAGGGLVRRPLGPEEACAPSLAPAELRLLAECALLIEHHFKSAQDIEWALDQDGRIWILQSRPLALADRAGAKARTRPRADPILSGGRTVCPGRVSGPAFLLESLQALESTPEGAILFLRRPAPEIVKVLPRIAGLVAEWGNPTGHAATLLREFKVPSVFEMEGAFERIQAGDMVSLDAVQPGLYRGSLWPKREVEPAAGERQGERGNDPISRRLLALHLLDPAASNFRPAGCKSTHDVLRFCHEKAIEAMFAINDIALERGPHTSKKLLTPIPVNLYVLDLGGGLGLENSKASEVGPAQVVSRPFQALWKGLTHPGVTWTRDMPASLSDFASVMASTLAADGAMRALGDKSYLLVADEYMNLNSRLAYHFSLVDACLSEVPSNNYISFRFVGGGATRQRRNLRACLIGEVLSVYGYTVDRRGDLVNAWLKRAPAEETAEKLDILGRLMACTSQLDMYMTSREVMQWYAQQFLAGNYAFRPPGSEEPASQ
jgi:pyruvate,water dikinase